MHYNIFFIMIKNYGSTYPNPAWGRPSTRIILKQVLKEKEKSTRLKKKATGVGDFSIQRDSKSIKTYELYERAQNSQSILSSLL